MISRNSGIRIENISLADNRVEIAQVDVNYTVDLLRQGQIETLTVSDTQVRGEWDENGLSFGPLDRVFGRDDAPVQDTLPTEPVMDETTSSESDNAVFPISSIQIQNADLILNHQNGVVRMTADVNLDASDDGLATNASLQLSGPDLSGELRWTGFLNQSDPLSSDGSGGVRLQTESFVIPGNPQDIDIDVEVGFQASPEGIIVNLERDIKIVAPLPAFGALETNSSGADATFSLTTASDQGEGTLIAVQRNEDGLQTRTDIAVQWDSPVGSGSLDVVGSIDLDQDNLPQDFLFETLSLSVVDFPSPFGVVSGMIVGDGLHGPIAVAEGPILIDGLIRDGRYNELTFDQLTLKSEATFRLDGLSLAFDLTDVSLQLDNGAYGEKITWDEPVRVELAPESNPAQAVTTAFGSDGSATLTFDTGLNIQSGRIVIDRDGEAYPISISSPDTAVRGFWVPGEPGIDIEVETNRTTVTADFMRLSNLALKGSGTTNDFGGGLSSRVALDLSGGAIRNGLPMTANFHWRDEQLDTNGTVSTSAGQTLVSYQATYRPATSDGNVDAEVGPLAFGGSNISTSDIYPLGLPFTPIAGEFAANISLPLGNAPSANNGNVFVRNLELETGALRITQLNTALALDSVWPLAIKDPQTVAIGLVQAGVPVTNVVAQFSLDETNTLHLANLAMDFAGGQVIGDPSAIDLNAPQRTIPLQVNDVKLPALAELSGLKGLQADGQLSGVLPLVLSQGDAVISQGSLTTSGPGRIRYVSEQQAAQGAQASGGLALAFQALEDFRYDSLTLTVSGSVMNELAVGIAIKGRNPSLYDGYPIEFNLNVEGELANVVRGSLAGYRVPESIRQQLMAFPSAH